MGAEQFQNEEALSDLVNRLLSLKVSVIALILSIFLPYPLENRSFPLLVCSDEAGVTLEVTQHRLSAARGN